MDHFGLRAGHLRQQSQSELPLVSPLKRLAWMVVQRSFGLCHALAAQFGGGAFATAPKITRSGWSPSRP